MTVELRPEDERLIEQQLATSGFSSAEEVIHRALESLDAEQRWFYEHREEIREKIQIGIDQLDRGEGLSPEECAAQLEIKKAAWRAARRQ